MHFNLYVFYNYILTTSFVQDTFKNGHYHMYKFVLNHTIPQSDTLSPDLLFTNNNIADTYSASNMIYHITHTASERSVKVGYETCE